MRKTSPPTAPAISSPITRAAFDEVMVPNYAPAAFIPVRGQGSRVWDQAGREYVDFAGGIAVNSVGHAHPQVVKALTEQANRLWHVANVLTNEPAIAFARALIEKTFAERVFFANSGAEANEAALKLARKWASDHFPAAGAEHGETDKFEIVACLNSFHGRTLFTVSVGGQAKYTQGFAPLPAGISHVPYNDIAALCAAVSDKTCCVIVEPIQGEGGVTPATREYLRAARALCDQHKALLIFDEVQCGSGRTGQLFAYMKYGVTPDILTTAKGIGGGFPLGVMLTTTAIAASFAVGAHGSTYGGNPLACAVGLAVLNIISAPETLKNVDARHRQIVAGLNELKRKYQVFTEVRGDGLLIGAELAEKWKGRGKDVVKMAEKHGLMLLIAGPDVMRIAPSLLITQDDVEQGLKRLDATVAELLAAETSAAA
ncbi:MAG TPA: aspartate aminotransferase family protein [Usitatibacteraceae bacterium]